MATRLDYYQNPGELAMIIIIAVTQPAVQPLWPPTKKAPDFSEAFG
jgi:hypothetical protein